MKPGAEIAIDGTWASSLLEKLSGTCTLSFLRNGMGIRISRLCLEYYIFAIEEKPKEGFCLNSSLGLKPYLVWHCFDEEITTPFEAFIHQCESYGEELESVSANPSTRWEQDAVTVLAEITRLIVFAYEEGFIEDIETGKIKLTEEDGFLEGAIEACSGLFEFNEEMSEDEIDNIWGEITSFIEESLYTEAVSLEKGANIVEKRESFLWYFNEMESLKRSIGRLYNEKHGFKNQYQWKLVFKYPKVGEAI
jgi:hypothetical protein